MRPLPKSPELDRIRERLLLTGSRWDPRTDNWVCPSCRRGWVRPMVDFDARVAIRTDSCRCSRAVILKALGLDARALLDEGSEL
jgi:hypothetical protein